MGRFQKIIYYIVFLTTVLILVGVYRSWIHENNFVSQTDMIDEEIRKREAVINCKFRNLSDLSEDDYVFFIDTAQKACVASLTSGEDDWVTVPAGRIKVRSDQLGVLRLDIPDIDYECTIVVDYKTREIYLESDNRTDVVPEFSEHKRGTVDGSPFVLFAMSKSPARP